MWDTKQKEDKMWLAAYLYYNEPWEVFLVDAVEPFVKEVMDNKWAEQYFFIRYWEKGPHIRLRFLGDKDVLEKEVKPALIKHFETYFKQHPSERQDPNWLEDAEPEYAWYPNNTVQFIEYEPETDRYGGPHGLIVSEKQFQHSSNAIISIIKESEAQWDYNRALGAAIQLHLGFAHSLGMDLQETMDFYSRFFQNWFPRAYYFFEKDITEEELASRREETLKAFETNFNAQNEMLVPFFQTVWEALENGEQFEQEWLHDWLDNTKIVGIELAKLQKNKQLITPEWYNVDDERKEATNVPRERRELWAIYDSYIHMTNNRLGILNRDEGYLAYLIRESMKLLPNTVQ